MEALLMDKLTIKQLCANLRLSELSIAFEEQYRESAYKNMAFEDRLRELLQVQYDADNVKRRARMGQQANLRWSDATIEDCFKRHIEHRRLLADILMEFDWVGRNENIVITGKTGVGKTHLACAIANAAMNKGITVLFKRFYNLLLELVAAENEMNLKRFRNKLNRTNIVILDDWGLAPLCDRERHLLFEFIESRECKASLIITSQYDTKDWYGAFQDHTLADSVLDRIVSYAHVIKLEGDSARCIAREGGDNE
ncbi:hypothetical protein PLUTE_a5267 [Pseudoalteromonas luteoviolacea DSM 6061]|nr:hypothetical protein [Pseudoalteromonas luteoviolacea DSM 6061]